MLRQVDHPQLHPAAHAGSADIRTELVDGVVVLVVAGVADASAGRTLETLLKRARAAGLAVAVDLQSCASLSGAALCTVISARSGARAQGRDFAVVCVPGSQPDLTLRGTFGSRLARHASRELAVAALAA